MEVLRRAAAGGRVAHAYLFAGPAGVGKATCARALSGALNCLEAPGEGCHTCPSCQKIEKGLHPDLIQICPEGALIKIDQVRALEESLAYPPHEGRTRLVLIDGAEQLNLNAANALLKSVEEPGQGTIFVLAASVPHRVVPTLISRCQRIRFTPLKEDLIFQILSRNSEADTRDLHAAAAYAEGSAGRALSLLEEEQIAVLKGIVKDLVLASRGQDAVGVFEVASRTGRDRQVINEALDLLRVRLRDLLLLGQGLEVQRGMDQKTLTRLREEAGQLLRGTVLKQLRALDEAQAAIQGNVNPSLVLENLTLCLREAMSSPRA